MNVSCHRHNGVMGLKFCRKLAVLPSDSSPDKFPCAVEKWLAISHRTRETDKEGKLESCTNDTLCRSGRTVYARHSHTRDEIRDYKIEHVSSKSTPSITQCFKCVFFRSSMSVHPWRNLLFPIVGENVFRSHMERTRSLQKINWKSFPNKRKATKMEMEVARKERNTWRKAFATTKGDWNLHEIGVFSAAVDLDRIPSARSSGGCLHKIFDKCRGLFAFHKWDLRGSSGWSRRRDVNKQWSSTNR